VGRASDEGLSLDVIRKRRAIRLCGVGRLADEVASWLRERKTITVSIVTRRLKEGKTYEDFRRAWYHIVGFGSSSKLITMINAFDPLEVIVMGFIKTSIKDLQSLLKIDVSQRLENPLDDVIEQSIGRKFGIMASEDDFSASGRMDYRPPSIKGKETDLQDIGRCLREVSKLVTEATSERDRAKKAKNSLKV
jgi:hypothetical protein